MHRNIFILFLIFFNIAPEEEEDNDVVDVNFVSNAISFVAKVIWVINRYYSHLWFVTLSFDEAAAFMLKIVNRVMFSASLKILEKFEKKNHNHFIVQQSP